MKIAIWHNLPSGGGKRLLHGHVRELVERGHQVEAWCTDSADTGFLPLSDIIKEHVLPMPEASIGWWKRRGNPIVEMNARVDSMNAVCQRAAEEMRTSGAQILLATSCRAFYMPYIGLHSKLPKVLYLHEPFRPLYEAQPSLIWKAPPRLKSISQAAGEFRNRISEFCRTYAARIQAREEYDAARSYDLILTNSFFNRESILRAYGLESEVCYPGIEITETPKQLVKRERYVAGMGSVTASKGMERAIRALAAIPCERRPELRWIANYSDPEREKKVVELAAGLDVKVRVLKQISDTAITQVLSAAALFIYTPRLEPFGLSPLEANACGTPVVALAEGGVRETIQDGVNGLLVKSASPDLLGAAVDRLLSDEALLRRLSDGARQIASERWSLKRSAQNLETFLCQTLQRSQEAHSKQPLQCAATPFGKQ